MRRGPRPASRRVTRCHRAPEKGRAPRRPGLGPLPNAPKAIPCASSADIKCNGNEGKKGVGAVFAELPEAAPMPAPCGSPRPGLSHHPTHTPQPRSRSSVAQHVLPSFVSRRRQERPTRPHPWPRFARALVAPASASSGGWVRNAAPRPRPF